MAVSADVKAVPSNLDPPLADAVYGKPTDELKGLGHFQQVEYARLLAPAIGALVDRAVLPG